MKKVIDILRPYNKWKEYSNINKKYISLILGRVLSIHKNFSNLDSIELSILLTDDLEISELNLIHRKKMGPTNILSFPDTDEFLYKKDIQDKTLYLGDLAISYDRVLFESLEKNISFYNHFTHLLIHGILHLLGYNHECEKDAYEMESLEANLLEGLSIPTPY